MRVQGGVEGRARGVCEGGERSLQSCVCGLRTAKPRFAPRRPRGLAFFMPSVGCAMFAHAAAQKAARAETRPPAHALPAAHQEPPRLTVHAMVAAVGVETRGERGGGGIDVQPELVTPACVRREAWREACLQQTRVRRGKRGAEGEKRGRKRAHTRCLRGGGGARAEGGAQVRQMHTGGGAQHAPRAPASLRTCL